MASNSDAYLSVVDSSDLEVFITARTPDCNGMGAWVLIDSITGGIPPYELEWSNGSTNQAGTIGLPGIHSVTVMDSQGNIAIDSAEVEYGCNISATTNVTNVSCNGASDGEIQFDFTGCSTMQVNFCVSGYSCQESTIFSNLPAGSYSVLVYDNICNASYTVEILEPSALEVVPNETQILACQSDLGSITPTVSGGLSPYQFLWEDGSTAEERTNLIPGIYTLTVTDIDQCTTEQTINIDYFPEVILMDDVILDIRCLNNIPQLILQPEKLAGHSFEWSTKNGAILSSIDSTGIIVETEGTYVISVVDTIELCTITDTIIVYFGDSYTDNLLVSAPELTHWSSPSNLGSITPNISGGIPPYSYEWSNGSTQGVLTELSLGIYELIVTDSNGCSDIFTYQIGITSSAEQNDLKSQIIIYPNPSDGNFQIDYTSSANVTVDLMITNQLGQIVKSIEKFKLNNQNPIHTNILSEGVYFLSVLEKGNMVYSERFIIVR